MLKAKQITPVHINIGHPEKWENWFVQHQLNRKKMKVW